MPIIAAIVLTILPGAWITYGLRLSGLFHTTRLALAVVLSPCVVGLQLYLLEAIGVSFAISAYVLVFLNLPCVVLLVRQISLGRGWQIPKSWLWSLPVAALLVGIPILIWLLIPEFRTFSWNAMIHTDIVYAIARDGVLVEETNLAGSTLAYGWIGHGYWSVICWLGDWSPTAVYPFTNILMILITFVLSYQLGTSGLGLHRASALLGAGIMFLGTNVIGMLLRIAGGYSDWWMYHFGDIRFSPLLGKFYGFEVMVWGLALLVAIVLVFTLALRKRVTSLDGLSVALFTSLGLIYPVLFPAGLVIAGSFMFLKIAGIAKNLPKYSRWEMVRLGIALLMSVIVAYFYLELVTADREAATFLISGRSDIRNKLFRAFWALGPFAALAVLPVIRSIRLRQGPVLLLALASVALTGSYIVVDLSQLEYKYVLAATICLAFPAAAVFDPLFQRKPHFGVAAANAVTVGLVGINLLLVFWIGDHIPGNMDQAPQVDERSFWLSLKPADPDFSWTKAILENTSEDTIVIARKPGVQLSPLVGRSMYVPSAIDGGHIPGYNLNHHFHLIEQRGYPAEVYDQRLAVVETLYTSEDEASIQETLRSLKELGRPVAIYYQNPDTFSLHWLERQVIGKELISVDQNTVWLVNDPKLLP